MSFRLKSAVILMAFMIVSLFCASDAYSQEQSKKTAKKNSGYIEFNDEAHEDEYDDTYLERKAPEKKSYIYEEVTMQTLSKLYWAVGYLDLENEVHLNNYVKINECDIYLAYSGQEFEWKEVQRATRKFLKENKDQFSLRFQFTQPLQLLDYDFKRRAFKIAPEFSYESVRRFEVFPKDFGDSICQLGVVEEFDGYTRGVIVELSRPFSMEYLQVTKESAEKYIANKAKIFSKFFKEAQTKANLYSIRKAYIVFKVKIFSHRKTMTSSINRPALQLMGALEGYEVYGDQGQKDLMFSRNYISQNDNSKKDESFVAWYEILKRRHNDGGMLKPN